MYKMVFHHYFITLMFISLTTSEFEHFSMFTGQLELLFCENFFAYLVCFSTELSLVCFWAHLVEQTWTLCHQCNKYYLPDLPCVHCLHDTFCRVKVVKLYTNMSSSALTTSWVLALVRLLLASRFYMYSFRFPGKVFCFVLNIYIFQIGFLNGCDFGIPGPRPLDPVTDTSKNSPRFPTPLPGECWALINTTGIYFCIWCKIGIQFYFLPYRQPAVAISFIR